MQDPYLDRLLATACDAALVVDREGIICYVNPAAEDLFGLPAAELRKRRCYQVVKGVDQSRLPFCRVICPLREMSRTGACPPGFDLQVATARGPRWTHTTVLLAPGPPPNRIVHLMHDIEYRMELEEPMRAFLEHVASLTGQDLSRLLSFAPSPHPQLTHREQLVLDYLAQGRGTRAIAREIGVSVPTVRNHIQGMMRKLSAHSRLEAVMRAVQAKMISRQGSRTAAQTTTFSG